MLQPEVYGWPGADFQPELRWKMLEDTVFLVSFMLLGRYMNKQLGVSGFDDFRKWKRFLPVVGELLVV